MASNYAFSLRTAIRIGRNALVVSCLSLTGLALAKTGYSAAVTPTAQGFNIRYAKDGTPLAGMSNTPTGVRVLAPSVGISITPSKILEVAAEGAIAAASTRNAWAIAAAAVGSVGIFAVPLLLDAYTKANIRRGPNGIEAQDTEVCTVAPCWQWTVDGVWYTSFTVAVHAAIVYENGPGGGTFDVTLVSLDQQTSTYVVNLVHRGNGANFGNANRGLTKASSPPSEHAWVPVTVGDAASRMWKINAPTSEEVQALIDLGHPPEVTPVSTSGPAQMPLFNSVQLLSPNERKTTVETAQFSYFPNLVKMKKTTTTTIDKAATTENVVTQNPDGTTTTSVVTKPATTTTEETNSEDNPEKTECDDHPRRAGCAELDEPEQEIPREEKEIKFEAENLFGSGSCPADLVTNVGTLRQSVKVWDWQKTCEYAMPLRAIVMSLAAFGAMMILLPGGGKS